MTRFRIAALVFAIAAALAPAARADLVHLNTGGVVKGEIIAESDEEVTIKTAAGVQKIFREDIARIEKGATGESTYKDGLKKLAPNDADGHYRLGVELKRMHLDKEARDCFERALKIDPNHLPAKIALAEDQARRDALVAEESVAPSAEERPVAQPLAKGKLASDVAKALEDAKKQARADDPEQRRAAWEKIRAVHAEQQAEQKDAVLAAVLPLEAEPRRLYERNAKRLAAAIPDYGADRRKARDLYRERWEKTVKAALDVIFDLKIYPDENHGKVGQKFVDEKVKGKRGKDGRFEAEGVEQTWPAYDQLVAADLVRFRNMPEEQAARFATLLDRSRMLLQESLAELESLGAGKLTLKPMPEPPPVAHRALLLYRAGRIDDAWALARDGAKEGEEWAISPWEVRLLERLRDLRVQAYNEKMLADKAPLEKGKRPNGEEAQQVAITNQYRMMMSREALEVHPCLIESARGHSQEMTQLGYFAHESPVEKNRTPSDRAANAGYEGGAAENISLGSTAPKATHEAWYNSSGHHRNILGTSHKAMGSGLDGQHWTQNFGAVGTLAR